MSNETFYKRINFDIFQTAQSILKINVHIYIYDSNFYFPVSLTVNPMPAARNVVKTEKDTFRK